MQASSRLSGVCQFGTNVQYYYWHISAAAGRRGRAGARPCARLPPCCLSVVRTAQVALKTAGKGVTRSNGHSARCEALGSSGERLCMGDTPIPPKILGQDEPGSIADPGLIP